MVNDDPMLEDGWGRGQRLADAINRFGGTIVDAFSDQYPTVCFGVDPGGLTGSSILYPTWHGWSAGVVEQPDRRLDDHGIEVAGVAAAALAISEAFQMALGAVGPGRREVGLSLWMPGADWRDLTKTGPQLSCLPAKVWLLGLGHLGQAYAWCLGLLPYQDPSEILVGLVDFDRVEEGNDATGMLTTVADRGQRKTQVVRRRLDEVGIESTLVERRFDEHFWPQPDEPTVAFGGFDKPEPRRLLGGRFHRVVDGALGDGPVEYLSIVIHTFPSTIEPNVAFDQAHPPADRSMGDIYVEAIRQQILKGIPADEARCGVRMVADVAVAAAFVGCLTSSLVVADLLRHLHGGNEMCVIRCDLRSPDDIVTAANRLPETIYNPGMAVCRVVRQSDRFANEV